MADREKFLGDTDFVKIPCEGLLSKAYAAERRTLIDPDKASAEPTIRPGNPGKFMKSAAPGEFDYPWHVTIEGDATHDGDTSYIAVVDKDRNMVSFEPSLHSAWGSGVVIGDLGIIFNCRGDYYSLVPGEANALAPGKRPRSTLQSTLVMKDGQPFMILGSPGGDDQIMRTMQTLVNVIDFGMNVQEAIEAPRWSTPRLPRVAVPAHDAPGRSARRAARVSGGAGRAEGEGPSRLGLAVAARVERGGDDRLEDRVPEGRRGSARRCLRLGEVRNGAMRQWAQ